MMGLLLAHVSRYSEHLHFNQRVHDGGFLFVHLGQLLGRYDLTTGGGQHWEYSIRSEGAIEPAVLLRYSTMMWSVWGWSQSPRVRVMGSNSVPASLRKEGFRMYPLFPLTWNLPWFRSMSEQVVWKFSATIWQPAFHRGTGL